MTRYMCVSFVVGLALVSGPGFGGEEFSVLTVTKKITITAPKITAPDDKVTDPEPGHPDLSNIRIPDTDSTDKSSATTNTPTGDTPAPQAQP